MITNNITPLPDMVVGVEGLSAGSPRVAVLPECSECCYDGHVGVIPTRLEHMVQVPFDPRGVDDVQIQLGCEVPIVEHPDRRPIIVRLAQNGATPCLRNVPVTRGGNR